MGILRMFKWLYPGMKIKRWIIVCAAGLLAVMWGTAIGVQAAEATAVLIAGMVVVTIGIAALVFGIKRMMKSMIMMVLPDEKEKELVDIVYAKRQLSKGPKIVAIGGGTGLSVLLHGLKQYTSNITAIVTVADDGGSSGKLRKQFDILPPGDIRNCLVALADAEPLMQQLFQFRFEEGSDLAGHNFGNLFITAMTKVVGDFDMAIKESSKVLAIRGHVVPSTLKRVTLVAEHRDGARTFGETRISRSTSPIARVYLRPEDCFPTPAALEAIAAADMIILGPGSLYTSVLPNLIIKQIPEAIRASDAIKIYICNVMTQSGETDSYGAADHVQAIKEHAGEGMIDYCLVNTGTIPEPFLDKYRRENAVPVVADVERIQAMGINVLTENMVSAVDYVRHDSDKIARKIIDMVIEEKYKNSAFA